VADVSAGIEQSVASVGARLRRLGYVVRDGNNEQVVRAVTYATTEWRGIGHPILSFTATT
jgi:hypothetical protein